MKSPRLGPDRWSYGSYLFVVMTIRINAIKTKIYIQKGKKLTKTD